MRELPIIEGQSESDIQIYTDDLGEFHVKCNSRMFAPISKPEELVKNILAEFERWK